MEKVHNKKLVGIVGCGHVFSRHLEAIEDLSSFFKLIALCDKNEEARNKAQEITGIKQVFSNFNQMLSVMKRKMNLVVIATPNELHCSQAKKALRVGFDVLIEKPIAFTEKDALSIAKIAKKHNKNAFVVLQVRHNVLVKILRKAVKKDLLGGIRSVSVVQRWRRPNNFFDSWRGCPKKGGGLLYEFSIHYLDIIQWLFGMPKVLTTKTFNLKYKSLSFEDTLFSIFRFPAGASGSYEVTVAAEPVNLECSISVIGEKGAIKIGGPVLNKIEYIHFSHPDKKIRVFLKWAEKIRHKRQDDKIKSIKPSLYHTDVYKDIVLGKAPKAKEAAKAIKLIEEIYKRAE